MPKRSSGLLLYRRRSVTDAAPPGPAGRHEPGPGTTRLEVLLVHPGGPYWARRDDGWWSIPKGEIDPDEDPLHAAERELEEELGATVPAGPRVPLGEVVQAGGKHVVAWGVEADLDPSGITAGTFEIEWPPRSGERRSFPEIDRAAWFPPHLARRKLLPGQLPFLDRLEEALDQEIPPVAE